MYVCQDPFHDTFPYQLHTASYTYLLDSFFHSAALFLFSFFLFPLSLFPCHLHTHIHVCMYISMYISITKIACRRISLDIATSTLLLHLSVVCTYVPDIDSSQPALFDTNLT